MVSPKSGEVRVGNGQGFRLIVAPTEVAAGSQVMVGPNGAASIAYTDTCIVSAPAAAITVVKSGTPCTGFAEPSYFGFQQSNEMGIAVHSDSAFGFTPKVDADAPGEVEEPKQARPPPPPPQTSNPRRPSKPATAQEERHKDHNNLLIVGGVVVGAGALAGVLLSQGGDSPASP